MVSKGFASFCNTITAIAVVRVIVLAIATGRMPVTCESRQRSESIVRSDGVWTVWTKGVISDIVFPYKRYLVTASGANVVLHPPIVVQGPA